MFVVGEVIPPPKTPVSSGSPTMVTIQTLGQQLGKIALTKHGAAQLRQLLAAEVKNNQT